MATTRPRGTNDILPGEVHKWQKLEEIIRRVCRNYGYQEMRTPIFEHTELFERGIGEATDIVEKEMYTFTDRGDRSLTLRPEGTAPVVRAFLENKLYGQALPGKFYYIGPMFRYERPQAGRYRQFYQFGVEVIGSKDPSLDVEMITMPIEVYKACGLEGFEVNLNSIGCPKCRPAYRDRLKKLFSERKEQLCGSCQARLERNPLRILDCKVDKCKEATKDIPSVTDSLCPDCRDHFTQVCSYLDDLGVKYVVNPRLVRGFDYYTKTVFELIVPSLGAQNAVGGGGRYDGLVEEMGGNSLPAVGFAVGMERLLLAIKDDETFSEDGADIYIAQFGGATKQEAVRLAHTLRQHGLWVEYDYLDRSLKAQMKAANRVNADWVIIIGEDELTDEQVTVRHMDTGTEQMVDIKGLAGFFAADEGEKA